MCHYAETGSVFRGGGRHQAAIIIIIIIVIIRSHGGPFNGQLLEYYYPLTCARAHTHTHTQFCFYPENAAVPHGYTGSNALDITPILN